ncbi:MAG: PAS domain S-box protein [Desulfuromonadales bacterium]
MNIFPAARFVRHICFFLLTALATLLNPCHAEAGRTVRVGIYQAKPLAFFDKDGSAHGFFVDMLSHIAEKEQWNVQYVPGSWQEGLDRLKNGKIDMVLCIGYTAEREKYMDFPKEYLLLNWGVLYRPKGAQVTSLMELEGKSVSALKGDVYLTGFLELVRQFNVHVRIQEVDSYSKVFKAVESGAVAAGVAGNLYGILNEDGRRAEQTPVIFSPIKVGYAVNEGSNGDLIATLDRNIAAMKADKTSIYHRELEHLLGKKDQIIPKEAYWALIGIIAVLLLAIIWNVILKRQVKAKTESIEIEIAGRNKAQEALRESLEQLRSYVDLSPNAVFVADENGRYIDVNPAASTITGFSAAELLTMNIPDLLPPESQEWGKSNFRQLLESGYSSGEAAFKRKNGETGYWSLAAVRLSNSRFMGIVTDITERKQIEDELSRKNEQLQFVLDGSQLGFWDWNLVTGEVVRNERWAEILGYTLAEIDFSTNQWTDLIHIDDRDYAWKSISDHLEGRTPLHKIEYRMYAKNGEYKWILDQARIVKRDAEGKPVRMSGTHTDITESKIAADEKHAFEQQMQHTQKLESLGVLSGGIAHDFNNILAIIMGYCSLTKMDYETAENNISEIEKAAERAAGLCRQMLAYAGKAQLTKTRVNLSMLVDEMATMLKSTIPQNAAIKPVLSAHIPFISGDASQLRQVIMNLIINASEAIGKEQGEVQVSLVRTTVIAGQSDRDYHGKTIPSGEYVCLEVTDNGCGMDEETKWRIFEPFYTTKFTGRGLGMSAVLGIINSHDGALQLFSRLGHGTTFKVYLPVLKNDSAGDEEQTSSVAPAPWQGSGTVLLVEDEEQIRFLAKSMLMMFGFSVLEAVNGKEALELFRKNAADVTLVVTDMGMPVMDGYELFHELKILRPELPIIVSSGFGDCEVTSRIGSDNIAGLINKPYTPNQLRDVLRNAVESSHKNSA